MKLQKIPYKSIPICAVNISTMIKRDLNGCSQKNLFYQRIDVRQIQDNFLPLRERAYQNFPNPNLAFRFANHQNLHFVTSVKLFNSYIDSITVIN